MELAKGMLRAASILHEKIPRNTRHQDLVDSNEVP